MYYGRFASPCSSRMMQRIAICLAVWAALLWSPQFARASQIIVFGDSLSDVGNAYKATGGLFPPSPYSGGRFSNGPVWVERLTSMLSAPTLTPSLQGGTDYAFAGAATGPTPLGMQLGTPNGFSPLRTPSGTFIANVPSLPTQVASYIASLKGGKPAPGTLATVWAGANDFFDGQTNPKVPAQNIANLVGALIKAGVTNFLVPNMPDLSKTPYGLSSSAATRGGLHDLSVAFDKALQADLRPLEKLHGIHIHTLNTYGLFQQIEAKPARFGLKNVTGEGILTGNPSAPGYLFWDDVHPTTAAQEIVALRAAAVLGVPEPSSLTLLTSGLLGLFGFGWRRRGAA